MMMMTSPMPDFSQEEPLFEMLPEPPNEIMIPYEDSMDGTDMDPPIPYEDSMDPIPVTEETASARTRPANEVYAHGVPCVEPYKSDFCLNGGHCLNYSIPSTQYKTVPFHLGCVCVEYFNGLRCEEKGLEGSYGNGMVIRNKRNAKLFQRRAMRGSRKKRESFQMNSIEFLLITISIH